MKNVVLTGQKKDMEDLKQGKDVLILVDFNTGDAFNVIYENNHKCISCPANLPFKKGHTLNIWYIIIGKTNIK